MKQLFLLLFICIFNTGIYAQTRLSGEVVDRNNASIPGVLVHFNNKRLSADMEGKFSLTYPDTLKDRRIYLQAFGYKNKSVMINKNQTSVRIVLVDSMYSLQTVTVSAPK